ncbi:PLP-dependent aminotransferase family protein [Micromonospora sp. KC723]|uniref:aminotransferase-like domain-containing protein n=1 Tax=Micromonospora sp. KC723 TaxID=2530381 RepID=UPI001404C8CE|nr:PLP-dependent aminotransferase family protein [Micromonospora sp. KC723]
MPEARRRPSLGVPAGRDGGSGSRRDDGGKMRGADQLTVHISLRREHAEHLPQQLVTQLARAIYRDQLAPSTRLPSTRDLARLLGVSRGVVISAYELLLAKGLVESRPGSGTYVRQVQTDAPRHRRRAPAAPTRRVCDFTPGPAPTRAFPLAAWRAAWREASYQPPLDQTAPLGMPTLREAIAAHLRRTRGIAVDADEVVVAAGLRQACWLLFEAIGQAQSMGRRIAVEQPAPAYPVLAARQAGWTVGALPENAVPEHRDAASVAVVFAEGNHPFGTVLTLDQRHALVDWAVRTGGYLVDISTEQASSGDGLPLPALFSLAGRQRVAMAGTIGDSLAPPGLAYLVVPRELTPRIAGLIGDDDGRVARTTQAAYARLLRDGVLVHRATRIGRLFTERREQVRAALDPVPHPVRVMIGPRGSTATLLLPRELATAMVAQLAGLGVAVTSLSEFYRVDPADSPGGIVLAFGHLPDEELRCGIRAIRAFLAGLG